MRALLVLLAVAGFGGIARADYAIVVGSNAGGPGQGELKYAEEDARKVGALLVELGGYAKDQVDIVVHPSPADLRDRLARLGERVAADKAAGKQSRVFFYYSGHARASAIDLGSDELPLTELRQRLFALDATLTVVVLDACQSGAFSRVKGAQPAADFSYSSRQHLDASGVAVLASSSGSELSQESPELHGSYFTHHLLVGLRGAGDANGDGEVSLDEAYHYAYNQTLRATAETAVGGQHVTFEADLKGHGEVALSFPKAATAAIILPPGADGQTLVYDKRAKVVVAETYKAKGAPVRIAVAPGDYEVLVRHGTTISHCDVQLGGTVDLDHCKTEAIRTDATKGGEHWRATRIEFGGMIGGERSDDFTDNLKAFGYQQKLLPSVGGLLTVSHLIFDRHKLEIWVGASASAMQLPEWDRQIAGSNLSQQFRWQEYTVGPYIRFETPLSHHFHAYTEETVGLGIGASQLYDAQDHETSTSGFGPALAAGAGLHGEDLLDALDLRGIGVNLGLRWDFAAGNNDLIGNGHASGGLRLLAMFTWSH